MVSTFKDLKTLSGFCERIDIGLCVLRPQARGRSGPGTLLKIYIGSIRVRVRFALGQSRSNFLEPRRQTLFLSSLLSATRQGTNSTCTGRVLAKRRQPLSQ